MLLIPDPTADREDPAPAEYMERTRELIGQGCPPTELLSIGVWKINEVVASRYSEGRVFCAGDAVHRHPPFNGMLRIISNVPYRLTLTTLRSRLEH